MRVVGVLIAVIALAGCGGGSEGNDSDDRPNTAAYFAGIDDCDQLLDLYAHSGLKAAEELVEGDSQAYQGWLDSAGFAEARMVKLGCPRVSNPVPTTP